MNTLQQVINFEHMDAGRSLSLCFLMAFFYVSSLYLWSHKKRYDRNEPAVLKRRFISVFIACFVCVIFVYSLAQVPATSDKSHKTSHCLYEWIGLKLDLSALKAFWLGILLTAVLFAGPMVQDLMNCYLDYLYVYENCDNISVLK